MSIDARSIARSPSIRGHWAGSAPPGTAGHAYITERLRAFLYSLRG